MKNKWTAGILPTQITPFLFLPLLLLIFGCSTTTTREYRSPDNSVVAICQYPGADSLNATWQFLDSEGNAYLKDCDSVEVVERGPEGHPMTVCFHIGQKQLWQQFYSTMQLRSNGVIIQGLREGPWVFYFPNGMPQTESVFVGGKEEGPYKVYRENGVPYYIGQYHEGVRTGTWEIYAPDGTLVTTQEY